MGPSAPPRAKSQYNAGERATEGESAHASRRKSLAEKQDTHQRRRDWQEHGEYARLRRGHALRAPVIQSQTVDMLAASAYNTSAGTEVDADAGKRERRRLPDAKRQHQRELPTG